MKIIMEFVTNIPQFFPLAIHNYHERYQLITQETKEQSNNQL